VSGRCELKPVQPLLNVPGSGSTKSHKRRLLSIFAFNLNFHRFTVFRPCGELAFPEQYDDAFYAEKAGPRTPS